MSQPISWKGNQAVYVVGTDHEDNTLRVQPDQRHKEVKLKLILPTLCVTYADMKFANAVGGVQRNFPDSQPYGVLFFDPPVVINGPENIEKFTYIRGADRVSIGPKETVIEWWSWRELIIPKLRIMNKEKVKVLLSVPQIQIAVAEPFSVRLKQYADGRHVGGVEVIKTHPDWKPPPESEKYDLWVRTIDGHSRRAIPEAKVTLYTWKDHQNGAGFVREASWYTNDMGLAGAPNLQCSERKLVIIERDPWLPQTWRFRPMSGQVIRQTFKLWKSKVVAQPKLMGEKKAEIVAFEAVYHAEKRDTLKRLAEYFCYNDLKELAVANGLPKSFSVYPDQELRLPGWFFVNARAGDLFEELDKQFNIPNGWTRPAQRTLHDNPTKAYDGEVIAFPAKEFADSHKMKKWY
jgi:hypothetical protein